MKLVLVRHAETDWNRDRRVQGFSNINLNDTGRLQAQQIGEALKREKLDLIYSSPLYRALDTAKAIAKHHGLEVQEDPRLMELDQGDLDGLTPEELRASYPEILERWRIDAATVKLPGGESMLQLQQRAWEVIQELYAKSPDGNAAVVSHNLAIMTIVCKCLDLYLSNFRRMRLNVGSITVLEVTEDGGILHRFNDICHLSPD